MDKRKRVTCKLKCPNPLLEQWLTEWRDEAIEKSLKIEHCYTKALESLKKYPLPLERGRDCKILKGFGNKLCQMLDEKLDEHSRKRPESDPDKTIEYELQDYYKLKESEAGPSTPKLNKKRYMPTYRSGAYAILLALYENNLIDAGVALTKSEVIAKAKFLCDKSFTKGENGCFYTAWSSMKTLVDKALVIRHGHPVKFSITTAGINVAKKLYESGETDLIAESRYNCSNEQENDFEIAQTSKQSNLQESETCNQQCSEESTNSSKQQNSQESKASKPSISQDVTNFKTVFFMPHTFEIKLIVDTSETSGSKEKVQNDPILSELDHLGVPFEVRHLKVGDYTWICCNASESVELTLPFVVERKRTDDFASSIKDGRYHEQKFRLKQCGMQSVVYLIESYGNDNHTGLPISTLFQAATNTLLQDGFLVRFTESLRGTAQYLNYMTKILKENYKGRTLMSCPKENLTKSTISDDLIGLMTFSDFNQSGSKYKSFTASEIFIKHLVQLKGVSIDKALAIVQTFPTVRSFRDACDNDFEDIEKVLSNITFGKKQRIGPVLSSSLCKFYTSKDFN